MKKEIVNIKVENIFPNAYQPRKFFNEDALNECIEEYGDEDPDFYNNLKTFYEEHNK